MGSRARWTVRAALVAVLVAGAGAWSGPTGPGATRAAATPGAGAGPGRAFVEPIDAAFAEVAEASAPVRPIATGLRFTEGPTWLRAEGGLIFSDIPANRIYRWSEEGGLSVWREPTNQTNGNTTDGRGRVISCEHAGRRVVRTGRDGRVEVLCATYRGKRLNSPNDVVVGRDGTVWFTDPPYGIRPEEQEQDANYVFRLDPGAKEPVPVARDFSRPNGLCFSPDGRWLYIADSDQRKHHVRRFRVGADRTLTGGEVFYDVRPGVPDGIRCDAAGRLYVTAGDGVHVVVPGPGGRGKLIGKIRTPQPAANCAFGGEDGKTLFITARRTVWAVRLKTAGAGW